MIEVLAIQLWVDETLEGVRIRNIEQKINRFADDTLVILRDPLNALQPLKKQLNAFHAVAGLEINYAKSAVLPINLPTMIHE